LVSCVAFVNGGQKTAQAGNFSVKTVPMMQSLANMLRKYEYNDAPDPGATAKLGMNGAVRFLSNKAAL
jgi:hypothetical protein